MDYDNGLESEKTNIQCNEACLNGIFLGNIDVRNSFARNGTFKLVIVIHGYTNDKFRVDLVSLGDLILSSEIFEDSKGKILLTVKISETLVIKRNFFITALP